ncbi:MAG: HAD family hydrolase [Treponemataceae bacterium]
MKDFDAVAFDLDGTLYPNRRFYMRLIPFMIREHRLLRAMGKARDALRAAVHEGRFYDLQARIMAEILNDDPETIKAKTERLIYRGWEPLFQKIKLFEGVRETLTEFKAAGLKLGLLSDFPPETKLEYLGISDFWDVVMCSENTGRLKPDPLSFTLLAQELGVDCSRVLYVGNSVSYDVVGSKSAGMKSALIAPFGRRNSGADFIFSDYRQLQRFVLT